MAYSNLSNMFNGICDSIRTKEGSTALINHQDIPARIAALKGNSNFANGSFTVTENTKITWSQYASTPWVIPHGLSVTPNFAIINIDESVTPAWTGNDFVSAIKMPFKTNISLVRTYNTSGSQASDTGVQATSTYLIQTDATNIKFGTTTGIYLIAGVKYYWVAGKI